MNTLDQKKLIVYVLFALVVFGVGSALTYFFLFRGTASTNEPNDPETVGENVGFPEAGAGIGKDPRFASGTFQEGSTREIPVLSGIKTKLFSVSEAPAIGLELSKEEGAILFFRKEGGEFLQYSFPVGSTESLSKIAIVRLIDTVWSPTRDRVAVSYSDGETVKSFLYRGVGSTSVMTLPLNTKSVAWSPTGSSIAYLTEKDGETLLTTADANGKNQATIYKTAMKEVSVRWPSADTFFLETRPSGVVPGYVFSLARSRQELKRFLGPLYGLTTLWSPKGERVLVGSTDKNGKSLPPVIRDSLGREVMTLDFHTLPEKCTWVSEETLYCAVPRGIPQESIIPDDYLKGELNTNDRIVVVDIKAKTVTGLYNEGGYDMANLRATKDGKYLFFIDRSTGSLWGVEVTR